jgi:hypothetical protein
MRAGLVAPVCAVWLLVIAVSGGPLAPARADLDEPDGSGTDEAAAQAPAYDAPAAPAEAEDPDTATGEDLAEPPPAGEESEPAGEEAEPAGEQPELTDEGPDEGAGEDSRPEERGDPTEDDAAGDDAARDDREADDGGAWERPWGERRLARSGDDSRSVGDAPPSDDERSPSPDGEPSLSPSLAGGDLSASGDQGTELAAGDVLAPTSPAVVLTPVAAPAPDDGSTAPVGDGETAEPRTVGGDAQPGSGKRAGGAAQPGLAAATDPASDGPATGGGDSATGVDVGSDAAGDGGPAGGRDTSNGATPDASQDDGSPVVRTVRDIVEVVPDSLKLALAALAALSLLLAGAYVTSALRARSLARQRGKLLRDVGVLQAALLPPLPDRLGELETSVAYRPVEGPAAGGDFYDALTLPGGRVAFMLGDVSGHGHRALERTAVLRHTVRAYLEAGLDPRMALQVAGQALDGRLGGEFATVLVAIHDPANASLTYASAGHPHPIVTGGGVTFEPIVADSAPPISAGERTGLRQTTVPLTPGAVICLYTDGLTEARTPDGLLGSDRLAEIVAELGPAATASDVIDRVQAIATSIRDDIAVCVLKPSSGIAVGGLRTEQLELSAAETDGPLPARFLTACGIAPTEAADALGELRETAGRYGGAIVSVTLGGRPAVQVHPRNVQAIQAAATRAGAAGPSRRTARTGSR